MKIESIQNIKEYTTVSPTLTIEDALKNLRNIRPVYQDYIRQGFRSGFVGEQILLTAQDARKRRRTTADGNNLSNAAGVYFLNEDIIGGSRTPDTLDTTDARGPAWLTGKLKLGPGVSLIEPPPLYGTLVNIGATDPELNINYNAPFGTAATRTGIKRIMDSKIDPEGDFFPDTGVYLTQGATEGIDLFMEMLAQRDPNSRVVFLGLSYYAGPYSAVQKGLKIDRIITPDLTIAPQTQFFPTADQVAATLPPDTTSLVLTMPNNPNGEIYSDMELKSLLQLAKERKLLVLFDCIFENMYFDENNNYKSRLLQIANAIGALDNIVVVDSLSKTQNLPGARIGFIATTNEQVATSLEDVVIGRRCNPPLTMEPVVQFESLARLTKALQQQSPGDNILSIASKIIQKDKENEIVYPFDEWAFMKMYEEWDDWNTTVKDYYRANLDIVTALLEKTKTITAGSPNSASFNTFVRLSGIKEGTNSNDFLAKLMFTLATYTQSGACFGLSQDKWDDYLGLWVRISYASSRTDLVEGLLRLIIFNQEYGDMDLGNANIFPTLGIKYNQQI